jgi:AAA15 family ATPase/GTPase
MRLSHIEIEGFRSIETTSLEQCGSLNVLIGRNNTGKSNILTGIKLFFDFFKSATLVATSQPPILDATYWRGDNESSTIIITARLELDRAEVTQIIGAISAETPQMRNALDRFTDSTAIECQVIFRKESETIAYVNSLRFAGRPDDQVDIIFSMKYSAAEEVAKRDAMIRALQVRKAEADRISQAIEADDWPSLKERVSVAGGRVYSSKGILSEEDSKLARKFLRETESYEEFEDQVSTHIAGLQEQLATLAATANKVKFDIFSGESAIIPEYMSIVMGMISEFKVHHLAEYRKQIGTDEAARILRLKTVKGQASVLTTLQSRVAELLGVQIDAFESQVTWPTARRAPAILDVDDFVIQANGSGIREALRVVLDYEFEKPGLLLIEEPEVHLHPALEIAMMQYLQRISADCQVFLTTHSTNFLDTADLRNVYLITKDQATHAQLLNVEEAEEAIPQELGIRLSSVFMYDRLVFVEGSSDEQVLRTFAATLGLNLSRTAVAFIPIGGARNFAHYASADTLGFLSKRRVRVHFILDRDERDSVEIDKLRSQLGTLGDLKVLDRRELENYLLPPEALARYLTTRTGYNIDANDIKAALAEVCQTLVATSAERRVLRLACSPVIPDRNAVLKRQDSSFSDALAAELTRAELILAERKENIAQLLETAENDLKTVSPEDLLLVLPGEEILIAVFQKFSNSFSKKSDGPKIAAEMREDEIPQEIADLLRTFTRPA